ncbi:hypothetical protein MAPG_07796 [Magnaporthiopsis poae ATCC 64411]|uniref:NACHT domain-containing protein n=1 Tax=Magnaporthiopsis poae (strain ATCC 64411 / 73-15) TaxID=644358 RepID=A0A0C4E5M3_MAGP6|nr:hypothetical protein MAPG_07796 [Magnaporthiopsis poae ATCC 64411]
MEPVSAVGLAAGVLQFVQFAGTLISLGTTIHQSADGKAEWARELETVYGHLSGLSAKFQHSAVESETPEDTGIQTSRDPSAPKTPEDAESKALRDLATECHKLCRRLLDKVEKLQVQPDKSYRTLRTFKAVLMTVWKRQEIADLEERLDRIQKGLWMIFYPVISQRQETLLRNVEALRRDSRLLHADQGRSPKEVFTSLEQIKASNLDIYEKLRRAKVQGFTRPSFPGFGGDDLASLLQTECSTGDGYLITDDNTASNEVTKLRNSIERLNLSKENLATIAKEQDFLRSLNFPSRRLRHDGIPQAHRDTFQWLLAESRPGRQSPGIGSADDGINNSSGHNDDNDIPDMPDFPGWLRKGNGIFWIAGKAGAGKSTLVKFAAGHSKTHAMLQQWAGSSKLSVATHYFWSAGSPMQKSQHGLLQALLYDIFRSCPDKIPTLCPGRWRQMTSDSRWRSEGDGSDWTLNDLLAALRAVAEARNLGVRYCIFVDGVDEFQGDHYDLCNTLKELSASPNLKLCLSSRPWNVFEDAFGADPGQKLLMLDAVDPLYEDKMAQMLSIAVNAYQPLHYTNYCMHDFADGSLDYVFKLTGHEILVPDLEDLHDQCRRRVNARSGGLLEVNNAQIEFLHRTVRDYLLTGEMRSYLDARFGDNFLVNLATLSTYVGLMDQEDADVGGSLDVDKLRTELVDYVPGAFEESSSKAIALLRVLDNDRVLASPVPTLEYGPRRERNDYFVAQLRSTLFGSGADEYVALKLEQNPCFFDNCTHGPSLSLLMRMMYLNNGHCRMVASFLGAGHDPSAKFSSRKSPWEHFIEKVTRVDEATRLGESSLLHVLHHSLIPLSVSRGASLDLRLDCDDTRRPGKGGRRPSAGPAVCFLNMLFRRSDVFLPEQEAVDALAALVPRRPQAAEASQTPSAAAARKDVTDLVDALCANLEMALANSRIVTPPRLSLYAAAARTVVEAGARQGEDMASLLPVIRTVFPGPLASPLVEIVTGSVQDFAYTGAATASTSRRAHRLASHTEWGAQERLDRSTRRRLDGG